MSKAILTVTALLTLVAWISLAHADARAPQTASRWRRVLGKVVPPPFKRVAKKHGRFARLLRAISFRPKKIRAEEAAAMVRPGDRVFVPVGHAVAQSVLDALHERSKRPEGGLNAEKPVEVVGLANTAKRSIYDREGKIVPASLFLADNTRDAVNAGRGSFTPVFLHRIGQLIRKGRIPVDVALVQVSKPDALGFVSLGSTAGVTRSALDRAKLVIAEMNPNVPRTRGDTRIHVSRLDFLVPSEQPLFPVPSPEIGEVERQIAQHVVKLIPRKNPTLQFGIGAIPDAVAAILAEKGRKDLRIHSEMISDGVMRLVDAGAVKGKVRYTFAMGSEKFLKWLDRNPKLKAYRTEWTNHPATISKIRNMVAINSAVRIDLKGQINAQMIKGAWYSGVGGQVDFLRGAMSSKGGKAILAMPSTARVSDGQGGKKTISRVVLALGEEDVVTTSMHDVQFVVTEHGIAALDGKTAVERARALIKIADPQFRDQLTAQLEQELAARATRAQANIDRREKRAEQRVAEQRVAEQRVAEQRVAEQRTAEQRVAEQRVAEQRVAEQPLADQAQQAKNAGAGRWLRNLAGGVARRIGGGNPQGAAPGEQLRIPFEQQQ